MSFTATEMELTPVQVYWKPNGATAFVDLGGTLGDCKISIAYSKSDIKADQTGDTPLDKRISGAKFMVETIITQVNNFQNMSYIFPSASLGGGTPFAGASPSAFVQWNNQVGASDLDKAGVLKLHPQNKGASTIETYDWYFYVACPTESSEIDYGPTKQSGCKVQWTIYPDTSVTPYRFCRFGDKDL